MSASNSEYEQYNFSQELVNIDEQVDGIETQLNVTIGEIEKLVRLSVELKKHQQNFKQTWKQHNLDKFNGILVKSKNSTFY